MIQIDDKLISEDVFAEALSVILRNVKVLVV